MNKALKSKTTPDEERLFESWRQNTESLKHLTHLACVKHKLASMLDVYRKFHVSYRG